MFLDSNNWYQSLVPQKKPNKLREVWEGMLMESGSLKHHLIVDLDDLNQSKSQVQELKGNPKDAENFIVFEGSVEQV